MIQPAFVFGIALLSFIDNADQLLERVDVRQRPSRLYEVSIVPPAPAASPVSVGCHRSLKSASIAMRVAVSRRPFLPGTLPRSASTTERSQARITSAPMREGPAPFPTAARGDARTRGGCGPRRDVAHLTVAAMDYNLTQMREYSGSC